MKAALSSGVLKAGDDTSSTWDGISCSTPSGRLSSRGGVFGGTVGRDLAGFDAGDERCAGTVVLGFIDDGGDDFPGSAMFSTPSEPAELILLAARLAFSISARILATVSLLACGSAEGSNLVVFGESLCDGVALKLTERWCVEFLLQQHRRG